MSHCRMAIYTHVCSHIFSGCITDGVDAVDLYTCQFTCIADKLDAVGLYTSICMSIQRSFHMFYSYLCACLYACLSTCLSHMSVRMSIHMSIHTSVLLCTFIWLASMPCPASTAFPVYTRVCLHDYPTCRYACLYCIEILARDLLALVGVAF